VAFCAGLFFGVFTAYFFDWSTEPLFLSICIILWAVLGYFVAEMLLQKSFRVWKAWPGGLVTAVALAALCLVCFLDVFGVASRVPELDQVESLSVQSFGYPYDSGSQGITLTDPEKIQEYLDLHQAVIAEQDRSPEGNHTEYGDNSIYIDLVYHLKNGSTLNRHYQNVPVFQDEIEQEGTVTWAANRILQDRELTAMAFDFDSLEQHQIWSANIVDIYNLQTGNYEEISLEDHSRQELEALWKAVRQDFDEGTIGVRSLFSDEAWDENTYTAELEFLWRISNSDSNSIGTTACIITLTPNARHTLAWMEENQALENTQLLTIAESEEDEYELEAVEPEAVYEEEEPEEILTTS
jgi:ABC-2 type transport system permease protein